jgi:hypothetical protein
LKRVALDRQEEIKTSRGPVGSAKRPGRGAAHETQACLDGSVDGIRALRFVISGSAFLINASPEYEYCCDGWMGRRDQCSLLEARQIEAKIKFRVRQTAFGDVTPCFVSHCADWPFSTSPFEDYFALRPTETIKTQIASLEVEHRVRSQTITEPVSQQ